MEGIPPAPGNAHPASTQSSTPAAMAVPGLYIGFTTPGRESPALSNYWQLVQLINPLSFPPGCFTSCAHQDIPFFVKIRVEIDFLVSLQCVESCSWSVVHGWK